MQLHPDGMQITCNSTDSTAETFTHIHRCFELLRRRGSLHLDSLKKTPFHAVLAAIADLLIYVRSKVTPFKCSAYGAKLDASIQYDAAIDATIAYLIQARGGCKGPGVN